MARLALAFVLSALVLGPAGCGPEAAGELVITEVSIAPRDDDPERLDVAVTVVTDGRGPLWAHEGPIRVAFGELGEASTLLFRPPEGDAPVLTAIDPLVTYRRVAGDGELLPRPRRVTLHAELPAVAHLLVADPEGGVATREIRHVDADAFAIEVGYYVDDPGDVGLSAAAEPDGIASARWLRGDEGGGSIVVE
ncbi:MAG: hypothetical protein H6710_12755 [Myxococcales bacterium]|nr:hypothetical protein [Myxococcales bacterium]MCB9705284.1 hypothetical protein [Myxococcales bacterium]